MTYLSCWLSPGSRFPCMTCHRIWISEHTSAHNSPLTIVNNLQVAILASTETIETPPPDHICKTAACSREASMSCGPWDEVGSDTYHLWNRPLQRRRAATARNPQGVSWLGCLTEISDDQVKERRNRGGYIGQKIAMQSQVLWKKRTKSCNFHRLNIPKSHVDISGYRYQINKQTQNLVCNFITCGFTLEQGPHRYCSKDHWWSS